MVKTQLYKKDACTNGYINTNGIQLEDLEWNTTDFMEVVPFSICEVRGITQVSPQCYAALYDKDQGFISVFEPTTDDFNLKIPENVKYVRYSLKITPVDDRDTFSFEMQTEVYTRYREDLYDYMKTTLSPNLTKGDLDIIIKLMCYLFGDLMGTTYKLQEQIDPDKAEESYLRHLGTVIGYEWNQALTAAQQRESMKLFIDIQSRRGTPWALENLIRVFGQDTHSYFSSSDLRGVKIVEYTPGTIPDNNGLYPGDIQIEIPQFSSILRHAIDNIKLIGTRLAFTYMVYSGIFKSSLTFTSFKQLEHYFDPAPWGYDPIIKNICPDGEDTLISEIKDWLISHTVHSAVTNSSIAIYTAHVTPFEKGHVWAPSGNNNYLGFLVDDVTLKDEHTMYE